MNLSPKIWIAIGFAGQVFFFSRFLVQWLASEKAKHSVVPISFWYFSVVGGVILSCYAIHRRDPVFIAGQSIGLFVYFRNLWLIYRQKKNKTTPPA